MTNLERSPVPIDSRKSFNTLGGCLLERFPVVFRRGEKDLRMGVLAKILADIKAGGFFTLAKKTRDTETRRFHLKLKGLGGQMFEVHLDQNFADGSASLSVNDIKEISEPRRIMDVFHGFLPELIWDRNKIRELNVIDDSSMYYGYGCGGGYFLMPSETPFTKEQRMQFLRDLSTAEIDTEATLREFETIRRRARRQYRVFWARQVDVDMVLPAGLR